MIRVAIMACAIVLVAPFATARPQASWLPLQRGNGTALDLAAFKGRVLVVDFWASWCAPCLPGLKSLERLQGEYSAAQLAIVPISLDRGGPAAAIRGYAKADITKLPLYVAPADIATDRFAIAALPTTILFDAGGREIARFDGTIEGREFAIRRALRSAISRQPSQGVKR